MDTDQITSVRVRGFEIRDEAARYRIYVTIKQLNGDTHEVAGAQQRWSKIITFSQSLTKQFGKDIVPVLSRPKRFLMKSKFDITHLEERAKSFDTFLKGLLAVVELRNTEEVTNFLSVEVADTKKGKNRANSVTEPNSAARTVLADQTFEDIKVGAKESEEKKHSCLFSRCDHCLRIYNSSQRYWFDSDLSSRRRQCFDTRSSTV